LSLFLFLRTLSKFIIACLLSVCSNPPIVENAVFSPSAPFNVNDQVTYTCNDGYELEGEAILTCQDTGIFLPFQPSCIRGKKEPNNKLHFPIFKTQVRD